MVCCFRDEVLVREAMAGKWVGFGVSCGEREQRARRAAIVVLRGS